ncbi:DUF4136 domain-containing protein [Sphingomonas sp. M1-B02]|uniref:DUF4136 domain-containing protein n=1 Tax=Sphingomonas sp. M1-B02 TaxID=3114300 RepID=UPI00223EB06B|nr:DUF4136 domain-containing protein [Sphingomonas sp. S6-11]UZK65756.1 DUF4136 domain-containing protein [Sphingomonas sp. S6-11]
MNKIISTAIAGTALLAGGCTASTRNAPVEATRYHLGQPMERTTIAIEPMTGAAQLSPEYQLYADAVGAELGRLGYVQSSSEMASGYIVAVSFVRAPRGEFRERPPVSIGLGGGSFGSGGGVGGGVSFGLGGKRRDVTASELWVQLRRRSDNTTVWEGRAMTDSISGARGSDPRDTAARLARGLFKDFPGESGITTTTR